MVEVTGEDGAVTHTISEGDRAALMEAVRALGWWMDSDLTGDAAPHVPAPQETAPTTPKGRLPKLASPA
ncbi:hypothetical protein [Azospirillum doebereinerae]